ncbi:MAG: hypothetical protein IPL78_14335 [Chloroflexi bacterium]|nr:hypothetical protein [Chloroflexota bacterium]
MLWGTRGKSKGGARLLPAAALADLPYTITSFDDGLGGATYPFLEQTRRAWRILTQPVGETSDPHPAHTYGLDEPTLRWVNGSQVNDLYVDGLTTEQFLEATGLELNLHKGGFVLSKRLSRVMRPHFVSGFFQPEEVQVGYLEQTPEEAKVWDGAGLISRRMLKKMLLSDDLTPAKRERLETELRHARRVEFTIMTERGQDKGHAIVADDLRDEQGNRVDFLLPRDTKKEVKLVNGRTFVGLSFVHGHNDMRLDIQSLINLYPFFNEGQLLGWLKDEGELFTQSVQTGQVGEVMARIDRHTTLDEVQSWPLREYLASGGQPMWFGSHVKSLMNQHLKRLNESTLGKMRLPIPGGRHYVMPVAVGERAGVKELNVPRGHIKVDPKYGTAWVNDEDWLSLPDSPKGTGIAGILGGADNDDALWVHPFTDKDGEQKVLAWRSPNQVGEYVVLRPTPDSHTLPWARVEGEAITYPQADSRQLPPRVDFTATDYLGLVDPATAGGLGEGETYSVDVMAAAMERAIANQGALGMYCNSLMLNKALFGRLPDNPPAPLEDIIDSAVKTGADLSQVVLWNYANSWDILANKTPIPAILHERLSVDRQDKENRPPLPRLSQDHWLDKLEQGVKAHIQTISEKRDELVKQTQPPPALFENVAEEDVRLGAGLNQAFAAALNIHKKKSKRQPPAANGLGTPRSVPLTAIDHARQATEDYLAHFPPHRWGGILRGALVSVYQPEERGSDAAAWLGGERDEEGKRQAGTCWRRLFRRKQGWLCGQMKGLQVIEIDQRLTSQCC